MRGGVVQQGHMWSYIQPEQRVPQEHPLRPIRAMVDRALKELSPPFALLYSHTGRPSIPPEQLLRALLLQAFYTIRSERQLMEQLDHNLLFRWFVGLAMDDPIWDATVFTKKRDRLLQGEVAQAFFAAYLPSLMYTYAGAGILWLLRGELSQATPVLERGFELCRVRNFPMPFRLTASSLGIAYALSGRLAEAIPLLEQALEQATSMKLMIGRSIFVARLGQGYLLSGRVDDALRIAGHALEVSREQRERGYEAYTLRLLGEIAAQSNPPDIRNAQACYRQAMNLADQLGMRPPVAHCHLGLGKLYRRTGSRSDADTHLAAATSLLREMDMRFWVEKAGRS